MAARILLVDDHRLMREGLHFVLEEHPEFELAGEAGDSEAGWRSVVQLQPDLVIMDLDVPGEGGAALTARIRAEYPEIKVVVLTGHSDARHVEDALRAGAHGYVLKAGGCADLLQAMKVVLGGKSYLCAEASTVVMRQLHWRGPGGNGAAPVLSAREVEVLTRIADGASTKEIAFALGLSGKTIETHRMHLMSKLKINSVAELTKYALREGLTTL